MFGAYGGLKSSIVELALGVPAEAAGFFEGRLLPDAHAAGLFDQQDFEIPQTEPGRVQDVMVMQAGEFGEKGAKRRAQFFFGVGPNGKGLLQFTAKSP